MNNTTKASLGATVVLLVIALVIAVQNMTELKSTRQKVVDRDGEIARLTAQLDHERQMNQKLVMRPQVPASQPVVAASPAMEERMAAIEAELKLKAAEIQRHEDEKKMLAAQVEKNELVREKNLTETQRKIRDAASIGEITDVNSDYGFAVINAGTAKGIEANMQFAIRRNVVIVGKVMVDKVEDANKSVVNIVQGSVTPGLQILPGDSVIAYPVY